MTHTNLNRRSLLAGSLALGATGLVWPRMAFAQATGTKNVLLVILRGAADGLAMLAPTGDPSFAALREATLPDFEGARKADSMFTIHPSFEHVGKAYGQGEALFVHATATSYRERSHFDGQNMLETGGTKPFAKRDGWLNRLVSLVGESAGSTPKALAIAPTMPLALRGGAPASSYAPSTLPDASEDFMQRVSLLYQDDAQLGGLLSQALETQAMASDSTLRNLRDAEAAGKLAASLMTGEGSARIAMIELDGWDTHANQSGAFGRAARNLDALLGAYRTGMGSAWNDTLVLVATEFGRTARMNGTRGTDHGTGTATFVMGGSVRGGRVIADWPGLSNAALFEQRDLNPTTSLEAVLAGASAEHLGLDPRLTMARLFPDRATKALEGLVRS